jgi:hypothetical protein
MIIQIFISAHQYTTYLNSYSLFQSWSSIPASVLQFTIRSAFTMSFQSVAVAISGYKSDRESEFRESKLKPYNPYFEKAAITVIILYFKL